MAMLTSFVVFGNPRGAPVPIEEANLAQLDINLALKWTPENIAGFGGDPGKSQSGKKIMC